MVVLKSGKRVGTNSKDDCHEELAKTSETVKRSDSVDEEMAELERTFSRIQTKAGNIEKSYLSLLLESYQDTIAHLKQEIKDKNDLIFDLVQTVSNCNQGNSSQGKQKSQIKPEENPRSTDIENEQIKSAQLNNFWQQPKNPTSNVPRINDSQTIEVHNRFSSLMDKNEWLREAEDYCDVVSDSEGTCSNVGKSMKSRKNVEVESNPEGNTHSPYRKERPEGKKRMITILGDSMIKDLKHRDFQQRFPNHRFYVKSYPGATTADMAHYIQPSVQRQPDLFVVHCGTNTLKEEKCAKDIANEIATLASSVKRTENDVIVSSIIGREDELKSKAAEVNVFLKQMCQELDIGYLDHSNILHEHLTFKGRFPGLHLNKAGSDILFENLVDSFIL